MNKTVRILAGDPYPDLILHMLVFSSPRGVFVVRNALPGTFAQISLFPPQKSNYATMEYKCRK